MLVDTNAAIPTPTREGKSNIIIHYRTYRASHTQLISKPVDHRQQSELQTSNYYYYNNDSSLFYTYVLKASFFS
jgi:hypothetical protein